MRKAAPVLSRLVVDASPVVSHRRTTKMLTSDGVVATRSRKVMSATTDTGSSSPSCGRFARAHSPATLLLCSWPLFCILVLPCLPESKGFALNYGLGKAIIGAGVSTSANVVTSGRRASLLLKPAARTLRAMCAVSSPVEVEMKDDQVQKKINLSGLKKETERQILRQFKKLGKAEERKRKAEEKGEPSEDAEIAVLEGQDRLADLNKLDEMLKGIKSVQDPSFAAAWDLAQELDVKDEKPTPPPRQPKKPKGKPQAPRKPYFVYTSKDNLEIWVGRGARDNDVLSLESRDPRDWWLHAAGCPGSHVVIRFTDEDPPEETVLDAACLALEFSKAAGGKQGVNLTRNVSKTPMAPAGQVLLRGDVRTIKMDLKAEKARLDRLLATKSTGN